MCKINEKIYRERGREREREEARMEEEKRKNKMLKNIKMYARNKEIKGGPIMKVGGA